MTMKILGDVRSGNCLKVGFTADYLGLAYSWVPVDIMRGETRTPEFLHRHPMGQVPVVEFEDGRRLAQSNAIIRYLAAGSELLPEDAFAQARVDEWLFWEQYSHEPYVAVCRFHMLYEGRSADQRDAWRVERGELALDFLDRTLAGRAWLTDSGFTIADISLLAYSRLAHEGGFDLGRRTNLVNWIRRCEHQLGIG